MDYIDAVYATLQGQLLPEYEIAGVENAFADGSECDRAYADMLDAYDRLRRRLGQQNEDEDVEIIINSLLKIQSILCRKMFQYGMNHNA